MSEKCPYCGGEFGNTKALGSHIHYMHGTKNWAATNTQQARSDTDKKQFEHLLDSCLSERGLPKLRGVETLSM
jgi:hypothetical protein